MPDILRYILIGTGGWGGHWCRNFLPRLAEMKLAFPAGAVDVNPDRLRLAQEFLGLPAHHCFTDPLEAIGKRTADFLIIAAPTAQHEKYVNIALTFNMHILCESPIAESIEACCRIYRKVRNSGQKMAVASTQRFEQDKRTLEKLVYAGKYGRVSHLAMRFSHNLRKSGTWGRAPRDARPAADRGRGAALRRLPRHLRR